MLIRKHRNGSLGQVELRFDRAKMKFYDLDRSAQAPPELSRDHGGLSPIHAQHQLHLIITQCQSSKSVIFQWFCTSFAQLLCIN